MRNLSFFAFILLLTSVICQESVALDTTPTDTTTVKTTSVPPTTETTVATTSTTMPSTTGSTTSTTTTVQTTTLSPTTTVQTTTLSPTTTVQTTTLSPTTTMQTTTLSPTTTTEQTTSTSVPTTSSTTVKTTTVISTTTGPVPTTPDPPKPDMGEWNITEGNVTCIRADLKIRFKIPVNDKFEYIALSPNATKEESSCNSTNGTQLLFLRDSDYKFSMIFDKDGNSKTYVKEIAFTYRLPPNIIGDVSTQTPQFSVQSGYSYLCNTGNVALENVTMEIMHVHLQAFGTDANLAFGSPEECEADNVVNDVVPIVVGCALLALVVVVLVAYFVGRRRSRQKGYQSV